MLKGLLRIRRYNQQETPYALQKAELRFRLHFGEAYSALRDRRPIPAALRSQSVLQCSGSKDPSNYTRQIPPTRYCLGKTTPDKQQSIEKKNERVKSDSQQPEENFAEKFLLAKHLLVTEPATEKAKPRRNCSMQRSNQ